MENLRLLKITYNWVFPRDFPLSHFPSDLRLLDWRDCPLTSWPTSFRMDKLPISRLKSINLWSCENLEKTPNLKGASALEDLNFGHCSKLSSVHSSTANLMNLTNLDFSNCSSLTMLPRKMNGLKSLKTLGLSYCSNLVDLPEDLGELECLELLDASHTSITHLPSMKYLINLVILDLSYCERLMKIHPSVGTLRQLERLNLSNCINVASLPSDVHGWESIRILDLSGCSKLENLPDNMGEAKLLEELYLSGTPLVNLPSPMVNLESLNSFGLDGNCYETFSKSLQLSNWFSLTTLDFSGNSHLVSLPQFVCQLTKIEILRLRDCKKLISLPNFKGLSSLKELDISCCNLCDGVVPNDLGSLTPLRILNLKNNEDDVRSSRSFDNTPPFVRNEQLFARVPYYYLSAGGCASLSLSTLSKIIIWCGRCTHLQLTNCSRLADSEECVSLSILKMFFQEHLGRVTHFSFTVPGNDHVNWWFHQHRTGSDMKIDDSLNVLRQETKMKLPTGLRTDTEWLGLIFCIDFTMNVRIDRYKDEVRWNLILNDGVILISHFRVDWDTSRGLSNHHLIFFLSPGELGLFDDKHIKISIITKKEYMVVINEIGMRVLYKKDVEEPILNKYEMAEANQQNLGTQDTYVSSFSRPSESGK
ncbi:hypothetical protein ACFE04_026499 [Oxalis oulophora]